MLSFLLLGAGIGFVAGISPGPVLTLVFAETLRGGWQRGSAVAAGPLLADGPIIVLAFALLSQMPPEAVRGLSLVGGLFLLFLAVKTVRNSRAIRLLGGPPAGTGGGFLQGLLARALTPHAYLFWFLVGAPLLLQAGQEHWLAIPGFLIGYYSTIVGSNVAVAVALHRWSKLFSPRVYRGLLLFSGGVLALYGLGLLHGALSPA